MNARRMAARAGRTLALLALCARPASLAAQGIVERTDTPRAFDLRGKTIAVIAGNGVEYNEAWTLPDYWRAWGARVVVVGTSPVVSSHEIVVDSHGLGQKPQEVPSDVLLASFDPSTVDAVYFPGGSSPDALLGEHRAAVVDLVRRANATGKLLTGFCHGPTVLLAADVARGRRVAGEVTPQEAEAAGAILVREKALSDGNLVTGNYPFLETFAARVAERLSAPGGTPVPARAADPDFAFGATEHFVDRPVPESVLTTVVGSALFTVHDFPASLLKPWRVVAVTDAALRDRVRATLSERVRGYYSSLGRVNQRNLEWVDRHLAAPAYLAVVMKRGVVDARIGTHADGEELGLRHQTLSAGVFVGNLRLAADRAGLGTNLVNGLPFLVATRDIERLLGIADDSFVAAVVAIGYPQDKTLPQPPRPVSEFLTIR